MQRFRAYSIEIVLILVLTMAVGFFGYLGYGLAVADTSNRPFSGKQAMRYVTRQLEFGPRVTGSPESQAAVDWLVAELTNKGWDVVIQPFRTSNDVAAQNLIAISPGAPDDAPVILLGSHFDSRIQTTDTAKNGTATPSPGANNGGSGTAILLELARTLDTEKLQHRVCLAFFDGSANAGVEGWQPTQGSSYVVRHLNTDVPRCASPTAIITMDMVGSSSQLSIDQRSDIGLLESLQQAAAEVAVEDLFFSAPILTADGDHLPFVATDIPILHIMDATYLQRSTSQDTIEQINPTYLQRLGRTLKFFLEEEYTAPSPS